MLYIAFINQVRLFLKINTYTYVYVCILYVHLFMGKNIDMIPTSLYLFYVCMYIEVVC